MERKRRDSPFSLFSFQDIITGLCGIIIFFVLIMLVDLVVRRSATVAKHPETVEIVNDETDKLRREIETLRTELREIKEKVKGVVVAVKGKAAPEDAARLDREYSAHERELAALFSQVSDLRTRVAVEKKTDAENRQKILEMEETRRILESKLAAMKNKKGVTLIPERGEFKMPIYIVCGRGGVEVLKPLKKKTYQKWFFYKEMKEGLDSELTGLDHTTHTVILLIRPSGIEKMQVVADIVRGYGLSYGRDPLEEEVDVTLGKAEGGVL